MSFFPRHQYSANHHIRKAAKLAGIDQKIQVVKFEKGLPVIKEVPKYQALHFHTSRHTFALSVNFQMLDFDLKLFFVGFLVG